MEFYVFCTDPDPRVALDRGWVEVDLLDDIDDIDALTTDLGIRPLSFVEFGVIPASDEDLGQILTSVLRQVVGDLVLFTDAGDELIRRTGTRVRTAELDDK